MKTSRGPARAVADITSADTLDFYIAEHETFWHREDRLAENTTRPYWRASSLGKCLRGQCFERAGIPKGRPIDDQARRTFQLGDDIHWFVRRRWDRMGLLLAEEVEIVDVELDLSGHVDAVMGGPIQEIPEDWREYRKPEWVLFIEHLRDRVATITGGELPVRGVEIKSINSWAFRQLDGVRSDHALQAAGYWILAERHPDALPVAPAWWEVLYIEKDPMRFRPLRVTSQWHDEALGRLDELNTAWVSGNWPTCTCGVTDDMAWEAKYCSWPNEDGDGCCGQTLLERLEASVEATL